MASKNLLMVINSGSSSLKFSIFRSEPSSLQQLQGGLVERIGDTANSRLNVTAYRSGEAPEKTSEQTAVEVFRPARCKAGLLTLQPNASLRATFADCIGEQLEDINFFLVTRQRHRNSMLACPPLKSPALAACSV